MATKILGKVALTPKGTWVSGTYNKYDYVYDTIANATYVALQDGVTSEPSGNGDGTHWTVLCKGIGVSTDNNYTNADKAKVNSAILNTQANIANGYVGIGSDGDINNNEFVDVKSKTNSTILDLSERALNVQNFGASGSSQNTTGTISAGSKILTLTNAIDFKNGQGISVVGAGAVCSLTTPTAPTVTPTGTTGTTTYQYQIVARDAQGGYTAVSNSGTTVTGNTTLNSTNYNVVSWSVITNAVEYAVYGRTNGSITLLGTTSATTFNDIGLAYSSSDIFPSTVPTSASIEALITMIVSGGGTVSLTLADSATTEVSASAVNHDDTNAIINAISACVSGNTLLVPNGNYIISRTITIDKPIKICSSFAIYDHPSFGNPIGSPMLIFSKNVIQCINITSCGTEIADLFIFAKSISQAFQTVINYAGTTGGSMRYTKMRNIGIETNSGYGTCVKGTQLILSNIENVNVSQGNIGFDIGNGTSTIFTNCWALNQKGTGYFLHSMAYSSLVSCAADTQNNGNYAYQAQNCKGLVFSVCGGEKWKTGFYVNGSSDAIKIEGCYTSGNNQNSETVPATFLFIDAWAGQVSLDACIEFQVNGTSPSVFVASHTPRPAISKCNFINSVIADDAATPLVTLLQYNDVPTCNRLPQDASYWKGKILNVSNTSGSNNLYFCATDSTGNSVWERITLS